ncbi:MAG: hypothetical protein CL610_14120 [Anaerolineaceae bacterium]|nr:hypothetical protein [Anaerolineaceae bacterium]
MNSTHYTEVHLIHQQTQQHTVIQLGGQFEHGNNEWVLDQTGVDFARFRFVAAADGVQLQYLEGDSVVEVDGTAVTQSAVIRDGATLRIDDETFRCELHQQRYEATQPELDAGWLTITGSVREHNEDSIGIYQQPPYHLFVVADGVGGAEAGEVISEFAVKYLLYEFDRYRDTQTDWASVFHTAVKDINDEARSYARTLSEQSGRQVQAGCTLTAIALNGWDAQIVHVGDSRLYLQHDGTLQQVTVDHSTFSTANAGAALQTTAKFATKRNVLIKGIGKSDQIEPDLKSLRLTPGDKLLLCSDGMSDRINDAEIAGLLDGMPPQKLVAHLAKTADERRSADNISVIVVRVNAPGQVVGGAQALPQPRAYIGAQPRPRLSAGVDLTTDYSTETGESHLPLNLIIPVAIVLLVVIIVGLVLVRAAG